MVAAAEGVVMNKYGSSSCDGEPMVQFNLTTDWAKAVLERMRYVKRKACSKAKVDVDHFEELKAEFLLEIKSIVNMDAIPAELVINFDQTALNHVPISHWTMDEEGAKRVEVVAKDDKRQITVVFAGSEIFCHPNSYTYEGKTDCCLPHYKFPETWHVTKTAKHWSNEQTMMDYFNEVILPYIKEKRSLLKHNCDQAALLIFDNFKAQ